MGSGIMKDLRVEQLACQLIHYSVELKPGEKVLIEAVGLEYPLIQALIKEIYRAKGMPFITIKDHRMMREIFLEASEEQFKIMAKYELDRMKEMDAYIGVRAGRNTAELSDVPEEKIKLYSEYFIGPVHIKERVNHTKWCVLRYPNDSMAQSANMSLEAFEDFYYNVCTLNYQKMDKAMDPLVELMKRTDKVRIIGQGTDICFSIKDMGIVKCAGKRNIPDGEVYTVPVKNTINGYITYNTPAPHQGFTYENIYLEMENGKIIKAAANDSERVNKVLDIDEGARYIGEFALGVNPYILKPMKDTLFDEKIAGSFHLTPGNAYKEADNGNRSSLHWDLVCIQRPEFGGGEIYFDDVLVRKDGVFILKDLEGLNPENLK
jgi:aminopeptidase